MKRFAILSFASAALLVGSCSKLDETFRSELESTNAASIPVADVLRSAYNSFNNPFMDQSRLWAATEHTTDEVLGPTRGPDWDDNGVWRVLHSHQWTADHGFLRDTYRELLQAQFAASSVLEFAPSAQQAAEARFLRALSIFCVADGWDQVPYRSNLKDLTLVPETLKGSAANDFVISELNAIMSALPSTGPAYVANQDAAKALLMKCYINKGVFANRTTPTFAPADLTQVITLADQLTATGKYSLTDNFYDNFSFDNDVKSKENIYTLYNKDGDRGGNVRSRWFLGLHYNMTPSGWNGFATLSDLYDKFGATDTRLGANYTGVTDVTGMRVGFLFGQQKDKNGVDLKDRKNAPLFFTREVKLKETGANLEVTGIRVMKYPPDLVGGDQADNDYVVLRYADVLLMKAEAQLRSNNAAGALVIMNQIRTKRGATPLASATLANLLDERARELYWEGWRRNDMIRFGNYLSARQEKLASDVKYLLFPIPSEQLAVNPNLTQNPGY